MASKRYDNCSWQVLTCEEMFTVHTRPEGHTFTFSQYPYAPPFLEKASFNLLS